MEIMVDRRYKKPNYTIGLLYINGEYWCNTVEDTVRDGGVKIPKQTAIWAGRYRVLRTYSPKFKKLMPLITGVKGFEGIRIHAGKDANSTEGCLIVGENRIKGGVVNSAYWFNKIDLAIADAIKRGEDVYITLK